MNGPLRDPRPELRWYRGIRKVFRFIERVLSGRR